ncbi:hypothetical protein MASR2M15_24260 [Anaerolineales bacterium]
MREITQKPDQHFLEMWYTMRRYYVDRYFHQQAAQFDEQTHILDLGGMKSHKRGYFNIDEYSAHVLYANLMTDRSPDVQCDAAYPPFRNASFDVIICGELLEHVYDPRPIVQECYRLLKPNGKFILTVPFLYRVHGDPSDYGRYTAHYWQRALSEAGFENIQIENQGGFWSVLYDMGREYVHRQSNDGHLRGLRKRFFENLIYRFKTRARRWDQKEFYKSHPIFSSYTTGYGVSAIKGASDHV